MRRRAAGQGARWRGARPLPCPRRLLTCRHPTPPPPPLARTLSPGAAWVVQGRLPDFSGDGPRLHGLGRLHRHRHPPPPQPPQHPRRAAL
eukprot:2031910-Rhodomonas_salina.1